MNGMRRSLPILLGAVLCAAPARCIEIPPLPAHLPEVKVKETIINVTPDMRIYLPNGSFDLSLRQRYRQTTVDFSSRYDFVDSFMGFNLDFLYEMRPFSYGLGLNDRVDFNEIFASSRYIQRSQSVSPYVQYTISDSTRLRSALRFQDTYTDSVNSPVTLDRGRDVVGELGYVVDTIEEVKPFPRGGSSALTIAHSFQNLGSDYRYTQTEFALRRFFYPFKTHYIEYQFQLGYPLEISNKPLSSFYYAGGYRTLRGYGFKEFRGDALIYHQVTYNVPIAEIRREEILGIPLSFVTWDVFFEMAKVGDRAIYSSLAGSKFSAGTGIGYKVILLGRFPVRFEISLAKAFEERPALFYLTLSSVYYSWSSE